MAVNSTGAAAQISHGKPISLSMGISGVRGSLNQQRQDGEAALALIESAAVPIKPWIGQNINIVV